MPSPVSEVKTVGILGGKGMLGGDLVQCLGGSYDVHAIDRENYREYRGQHFDVLVNADGNSRRFWANENPAEDFELSTSSVIRSLFDFHYKKYVHISSSDIYENPTSLGTTLEHSPGHIRTLSPYGFHKRLSEELVKHYTDDFLVLRSAALLGSTLHKGVVYDILHGSEVYVTRDSRIQFITTDAVADIIKTLLARHVERETFNAGGLGTVTPEAVGALAKKPVLVRNDAKPQQYEMNTEKIQRIYPALKTSEEYVKIFMKGQRLV